jgi:hypothetical protein
MQTYHGEATVNNEGQVILSLPFPKGQHVKILARPLTGSEEDDKAWERMALESFFKDDSNLDAMYDNYDEWRKNRDAAENIK